MEINVQTVPDLLITTRGNQTALARQLGVSRLTLKKYIHDKQASEHAVINGVLMTISQRQKGRQSMKREYTTGDIKQIKQMVGHYSPQQIAESLNRSKAGLLAFASRNGIYFSRGPHPHHTQASVNEVVRLKSQGKSYRQIVALTGIPLSTCAYWCRRQNEKELVSAR